MTCVVLTVSPVLGPVESSIIATDVIPVDGRLLSIPMNSHELSNVFLVVFWTILGLIMLR